MPGMFNNQFASQRGNLTSGKAEVPPTLQQFLSSPSMFTGGSFNGAPTGGQSFAGAVGPSQGVQVPVQGAGLAGAASKALQTFNFRRNYAEGGLVGAPQPQGAPAVPGMQLQQTAQQVMQANPQVVQQMQQAIMQAVQSGAITVEQLQMAVQLARAAAQNPELYPRLRELAIQSGLAQEDELPPQYDQGIVFAILLAGEAAQQAMQGGQQAAPGPTRGNYAEGGAIPPGKSPSGDKSGKADDIKINVSGGEYVIPKHVVLAKGTDFFDKMIESYDPNNPDSKVNKPK